MFCSCSRSKVFFEAKISRGELTSFLSLSSFLSHTRPFSQQGYTAPEVVSNARSYDGRAADIWSSAVMLFVMLFCEYPFERVGDGNTGGNKFAKVLERIQKVDYRFPANIPVSTACRDLISKVLVADVSKRLTIEQIQAHPWYQVDLPPGVTSMNEQVSLFRVPFFSFREGSLLLFERKLEALAPRFTPSHAQNVQRTTPTKKIEKKTTPVPRPQGPVGGPPDGGGDPERRHGRHRQRRCGGSCCRCRESCGCQVRVGGERRRVRRVHRRGLGGGLWRRPLLNMCLLFLLSASPAIIPVFPSSDNTASPSFSRDVYFRVAFEESEREKSATVIVFFQHFFLSSPSSCFFFFFFFLPSCSCSSSSSSSSLSLSLSLFSVFTLLLM